MNSGKIILIEDNEKDASGVSEILEAKGYKICRIANGKEALKRIKDEKFDLVILDLLLPDIKGEDVCSTLKKKRLYKNIPILVLSIKDEIEDIQELLERGADDYIIKPPRAEHLLEKVEVHISKSRLIK